MPDKKSDVNDTARALIAQHGSHAVYVSIERLNESIDRGDWRARDFWAQVTQTLHEHQRSGGSPKET